MGKDLVIVESPAKARTVGGFLGKNYVAKASMGHGRDLPKKKMGVEIDEKGFRPSYTVLPDKRKIVSELRKSLGGGRHRLSGDRPGPGRRGDLLARYARSKDRRV